VLSTPLHVAVSLSEDAGGKQVFDALLGLGAKIDTPNANGLIPIFFSRTDAAASWFIDHKSDLGISDLEGVPLIFRFVSTYAMLSTAIASGQNISLKMRDTQQRTILMECIKQRVAVRTIKAIIGRLYAQENNNKEAVKEFINSADKSGYTVAHYIVMSAPLNDNIVPLVELLLQYGLEYRQSPDGKSLFELYKEHSPTEPIPSKLLSWIHNGNPPAKETHLASLVTIVK